MEDKKEEVGKLLISLTRRIIVNKIASLDKFALALVTIGALNYGLMGLFNLNLLGIIFGGQDSIFSRLVFSLIGLAGLYCLPFLLNQVDSKSTKE